ncbi:MAG: HPF/RaiA family ribosome-associated protein [Bacteroidales bacterium]
MEINVKSLKFDADQKLLDYVQKKVSRLERFYDGIQSVDVTLSLLNGQDNKCAKLQTRVLGQDIMITRSAKSFEDALSASVDAMKENITRAKEKVIQK